MQKQSRQWLIFWVLRWRTLQSDEQSVDHSVISLGLYCLPRRKRKTAKTSLKPFPHNHRLSEPTANNGTITGTMMLLAPSEIVDWGEPVTCTDMQLSLGFLWREDKSGLHNLKTCDTGWPDQGVAQGGIMEYFWGAVLMHTCLPWVVPKAIAQWEARGKMLACGGW